jgi:replicative DNA helicase
MKTIPQALECERSFLSCCWLEKRLVQDYADKVSIEDFYRPEHRIIWTALLALNREHGAKGIDTALLLTRLADQRLLDDIGGESGLTEILSCEYSAANAEYYAKELWDKSMRRQMIQAAANMSDAAYDVEAKPVEVVGAVQREIISLASRHIERPTENFTNIVAQAFSDLDSVIEGGTVTVPTGFKEIDDMCAGGFWKGEMTVIAGRPSMGKSAMALNLAISAAIKDFSVVMYSMEMTKGALVSRTLSLLSGVDMQKIRNGTVNSEEYKELLDASGRLADKKLFLDDARCAPLEVLNRARRTQAEFGLDLIIIDFLHAMKMPAKVESQTAGIAQLSGDCKAISVDLNIPVVLMAQMNRANEMRTDPRPRMSDLRQSGSIEQDADNVWMLHRESYYHRGDFTWLDNHRDIRNTAEVIIEKQRQGPVGVVKLHFVEETMTFNNLLNFGANNE